MTGPDCAVIALYNTAVLIAYDVELELQYSPVYGPFFIQSYYLYDQ